ncbi:unnamed protein product [Rotaria sp. Silwood1]|nr:unnamed protein product [Rotaria sp. Silwood1]
MTTFKMSVKGKYIVDPCGRVRIFRGINGVLKYFPWYPYKAPDPPLLNSTYMENLRNWGFNVIRLETMWAGAEPQEGQYNETYLSKLKDIVELANNYNIYIFHDMHQDLLTSALKGLDNLSGYDGIPLWLFRKFPNCSSYNMLTCPAKVLIEPCIKYPCPFYDGFDSNGNWFFNYFTSVCSNAFQQLYKNNSGAVDSWNPTIFSPYEAGCRNLLPVYNILNAAIRTVDTQTLLFYEPVTYAIDANGFPLGTGFNTVPGGNLSANLSVLSYHWYCTTLSIGLPIPVTLPPGVTLLTTGTTCNIQGDLIFQAVDNDITQTGGSSFLTEFGFDGRTNTGAQQNDYVLDKSDQYFQSWTVWGQSFINESNNIQYDILSQFNRPYAYAIAGTPLFMFYDRNDTHCFILKYTIDLTITCPSQIYLPSTIYPRPNGYNITLTCELSSNINADDPNSIDINTTNSTANGCCAIVIICPT